jgi:hypothetical protein
MDHSNGEVFYYGLWSIDYRLIIKLQNKING